METKCFWNIWVPSELEIFLRINQVITMHFDSSEIGRLTKDALIVTQKKQI